jgi:sugar lactone lactonase YvrE
VSDQLNGTIRKIVRSTGIVSTVAGAAGLFGSTDGTGAAARFFRPRGIAVDAVHNLYVADSGNLTIRKITPDGVVTTLAGSPKLGGATNATGAAARFSSPTGVAVDRGGNVYVTDSNNRAIRKITPDGVVTTLAGSTSSPDTADGTGAAAGFMAPSGIAVGNGDILYVAEERGRAIRKVTTAGVVTTLARDLSVGTLNGVAVDASGTVYVADQASSVIRTITSTGVMTTLAGVVGMPGIEDGTGAAARFIGPHDVVLGNDGTLYVIDDDTIRAVAPSSAVTTLAGIPVRPGDADGAGTAARFLTPTAVTVDAAGNIYVADSNNDTIRKLTPDGAATTLAGAPRVSGSADGSGPVARFSFPSGTALDATGNLYIADQSNQTIRKLTPDGVVTTLAGTAGESGSADGTGADARFSAPFVVATDRTGNVYVSDRGNSTIRKITPDAAVTTLAGTPGVFHSADGVGTSATFESLEGIAVDADGNIYAADGQTIRKVTPDGVVTTLAGAQDAVGSDDGTGPAARFNLPAYLAVDAHGNVYVTDYSSATIRKITPAGVTTTIAGLAGVRGVVLGAAARFAEPNGIAVSGDSLVITDANAVLVLRHGAQ